MLEIRFHGRGGQGAVTTAELVARAAVEEGRYSQAFPSFGPERRGAPVMAFCRVDDERIRLRSQIKDPDVAVVLDPSLLDVLDPASGLKPGGILIINSHVAEQELRDKYQIKCRIALVDATKIAVEEMKRPITNTAMMGALVKATGVLKLESLEAPIKDRFGKIADINWKAVTRAFSETVVKG
ncbi:MAG TPA: pyruvate ferredoxin oxidoreductase subunit gamma [bacterium]|nr:pyruvate ferredoxin oxidoreductase subunit gamma [bacterium]